MKYAIIRLKKSGGIMKINLNFYKNILYVLIVFVIILGLFFGFWFYRGYLEKYENAEKYKDFVGVTQPITEDISPKLDIDFQNLQAANPDIFAWLDIPDTTISYPILRSEKEDFYLTHNADKEESQYGAIYTQNYNAADFSDFNTIIYGHNMRDGSMFGTLRNFKDKEFFENHRIINIYTPSKKLTYTVFAAYTNDDTHILFDNDFSDIEVRRKYIFDIQSGKKNSNVDREINISEYNKIITLSTCTTPSTKRLLVQAVLTKTE